ncbi:MAG TPA: hypothetical protein VIF09_24020 [Polyangiaceae bacterium]|jgi:hypothetical protein
MRLRAALALATGLSTVSAVVACGSDGVNDYRSRGGGQPATAVPEKADSGTAEGGRGATGSSSGSSGGGSSSGGGGGDAGATPFGNVAVASFTLINTNITTLPAGASVLGFDPIQYGAKIDLAIVGDKLSMVVTPPQVATVGSMAFALDATFTHTANTVPYSLCGDDGKGKFNPCLLTPGPHTLTVTVYPETALGGAPYQPPTMFEFTVIDSAADAGDAGGE